ncbi:hypothetical protein [Paraburkholderia fungorum]|uniref:hypothetical protein n=1 Tax=Paraburkholderia fungorum TaxID=134537 RepID=UPI001610BB7D|nr:hypothetical protein [Paraburkholderia fungorum]MBB5546630.1 hypothetical protein [Paraburkholderia fungorum]
MASSPFSNCRFRECDLPGQCKSEGRCHHPATAQPADLENRAERAAKALERERCKQFEWSDDEFEIWWNKDDRCNRADRIAEARLILLAALPASQHQQPAAYQVHRIDGRPLAVWENCTQDLYEATLATGRYSGYESGPACEVRRLFAGPAEWPAPLTNERILEIRNQIAVPVSAECAGYDALWIRAVRVAIAEAHAGTAVTADVAFDQWYAGQRHQLVNEQVCRLIWTRAWERCLAALRAGALEVDGQHSVREIAQSLVTQDSSTRNDDARLDALPRPTPELLECLQRFAEVCADDTADGHTESKADIQALAELGAVRTGPFGRTYMTAYGRWLLSATCPDQDGSPVPADASWRDLLEAVLREVEDGEYLGPWSGAENAPGHGHDVPGIWDSHNGVKSGMQCAWCMTWNKARSALAVARAAHEHDEE